MKKNILITGVAGLLGSRFADWILKNKPEFNVIGIDDLSGGYKEHIPKEVKFYELNCIDDSLESVFMKNKPTHVYHFAAYAAEGLSPFVRKYNYTNNLLSTVSIVNCCINFDVKRLVFTSSMAVYGHGEGGIFHEDMRTNPIDPYGIAKAACEKDIKIANEMHGLDYCIIRPHNVYGINQNIWDKYRNVLGIWMYYHLNGKPLSIFGDGTQTRDFVFVKDVANANILAMMSEINFEFFNIGNQESISILELAQMIIKKSGLDLEPEFKKPLEGDAKISLSDISLVKNKLNWKPTYKLEKWFEEEVFKK